ncbi:MAG: hypothetical protein ACK6CT_14290 [Planctomycetia bacterium]
MNPGGASMNPGGASMNPGGASMNGGPGPHGDVRLLYCRCVFAQVVPADVKQEVLAGLAAAGVGFEAVPDLCAMAARRDPELASLAALARQGGTLRIAACWPRAVRGLFHLADAPVGEDGVDILNMRTLPAADVLSGLLNGDAAAIAASAAARSDEEAERAAAGRIAALGSTAPAAAVPPTGATPR